MVRLTLIMGCLVPSLAGAARSDPAAAARAAGEPPLGEILRKQGYTIDVDKDEIDAPLFVKAGPGPVTVTPIAAYGLPKRCHCGWYHPANGVPERHLLWTVDADHNKQAFPPVMPGSITRFDPGEAPFGLWVSSEGFKNEIVSTEDALQRSIARFKPDDQHKAHVFPVKKAGKLVPNEYVIGWEYSTNNDDQDMVTLVTNVRPASAPAAHSGQRP
jgi:hypothetical protein